MSIALPNLRRATPLDSVTSAVGTGPPISLKQRA